MHDIFISYSRKDASHVEGLSAILKKAGFSVWYDKKLNTGTSFDDQIAKALDNSRCVLVLWTANSIQSEWIRVEAEEGRKRGALVPVVIGEIEPPLAFRNVQFANFSRWNGKRNAPEFVKLEADLQIKIKEHKAKAQALVNQKRQKARPKKMLKIALGVVFIGTALFFGVKTFLDNMSHETCDNLRTQAESRFKLHEYAAAASFYDSVFEQCSDSADVKKKHLCTCLSNLDKMEALISKGNTQKAKEYFDLAKAEHPDNSIVMEQLEKYKHIFQPDSLNTPSVQP